MDITDQTLLLAYGLGLLGFVEPCTIGAHMLFLGSQRTRPMGQRLSAALIFLLARLAVMGGFGGMIVVLGQRLIGLQTGAWLIFGAIYLGLGATILAGWDKPMRRRFGVAPDRWKMASSPLLQGLAFGLNIPACAAPILFGLMGTATAIGSASMGFFDDGSLRSCAVAPVDPALRYPWSCTPPRPGCRMAAASTLVAGRDLCWPRYLVDMVWIVC